MSPVLRKGVCWAADSFPVREPRPGMVGPLLGGQTCSDSIDLTLEQPVQSIRPTVLLWLYNSLMNLLMKHTVCNASGIPVLGFLFLTTSANWANDPQDFDTHYTCDPQDSLAYWTKALAPTLQTRLWRCCKVANHIAGQVWSQSSREVASLLGSYTQGIIFPVSPTLWISENSQVLGWTNTSLMSHCLNYHVLQLPPLWALKCVFAAHSFTPLF